MNDLLNELNEYLRLDGDEDSSLFLHAAIVYLENAGVKQPSDYYLRVNGKEVYAQHRLAIYVLATHFYENRIVINPNSIKVAQIPIPYGLESMILQLKWVDPV
jgi:hypothetical protein